MEEKKKAVTAVILMAGSGKRMHTEEKKQFLPFRGRPLFYASVERFLNWEPCNELILVVGKEEFSDLKTLVLKEGWGNKKPVSVVLGGEERFDSVYRAIQDIEKNGKRECLLYIHDAARPFFTEALLDRLYQAAKQSKAVIPGLPVKDTIKIVEDGFVNKSLERTLLFAVQTPQVFEFELINDCYKKFLKKREEMKNRITDDSMIVEEFSEEKVKLIPGEETNQKITVAEDLKLLERR